MPPSSQARWFSEEVRPHEPLLRAYLRGSFPAVRDVDDVVQESYLRIWRFRACHPIRSAKAFLFTVARRVALNLVRKNHNAPFVDCGDLAASRVLEEKAHASDLVIARERIELLADALMSLPPRCRESVILHKLKGFSQREVAARLGISERTVEGHVRAGLGRLLACLEARGFKDCRTR